MVQAEFEVLLQDQSFRRKLCNVAQRVLRRKHSVEMDDVIQNGLFAAWLHLHRFNGGSSLSTWICSIVIHEALMARRRHRSRAKYEYSTWDGASPEWAPDPLNNEQTIVARLVLQEMEKTAQDLLTPKQMIAFVATVSGESSAEISITSQIPEGTIRRSLMDARRILTLSGSFP